jgi:hypothetical protein
MRAILTITVDYDIDLNTTLEYKQNLIREQLEYSAKSLAENGMLSSSNLTVDSWKSEVTFA